MANSKQKQLFFTMLLSVLYIYRQSTSHFGIKVKLFIFKTNGTFKLLLPVLTSSYYCFLLTISLCGLRSN